MSSERINCREFDITLPTSAFPDGLYTATTPVPEWSNGLFRTGAELLAGAAPQSKLLEGLCPGPAWHRDVYQQRTAHEITHTPCTSSSFSLHVSMPTSDVMIKSNKTYYYRLYAIISIIMI